MSILSIMSIFLPIPGYVPMLANGHSAKEPGLDGLCGQVEIALMYGPGMPGPYT